MEMVLKIIDKNDILGFITYQELKDTLIKDLGITIDDQEIAKMIQEADRDGNGKVDYQEFVRVLQHEQLNIAG